VFPFPFSRLTRPITGTSCSRNNGISSSNYRLELDQSQAFPIGFHRSSYASAGLSVVILSVCLFVCLSVTRVPCDKNQTTHCGYFDTTRKVNHSSFLTPTLFGGQCPFRLKLAPKVTHPFETRRLRQIYAYNVSTVRDSEKKFNYDE